MAKVKDFIVWHSEKYGTEPADLSRASEYAAERQSRYAAYEGRENDFIAWHREKYGVEPDGLSHVDEYLAERGSPIAQYTAAELEDATGRDIRFSSPSIALLLDIQRGAVDLYNVSWRDFEAIVAELLARDGWEVELRGGTRDGGVDIIAAKSDLACGEILTVWQAKRLSEGRRVELSTVRELADTRTEFAASKGVLVTSSYLTKGALNRIHQDAYLLGKVDRDDLRHWIRRYKA